MNGHNRNGYALSIMPGHDELHCYLCGKNGDGKLDRHEIFHGANRNKSKRLGLWVYLCHNKCHLYGVHQEGALDRSLKTDGQRAAMETYGWSEERFISEFGRSYLDA